MKLSILMPSYNEQHTIRAIVNIIAKTDVPGISDKELIIVDDGSTDATQSILKELVQQHKGLITIGVHEHNTGKGAAIRTAVGMATGDICVIQDADLEYDPADYAALIKPILTMNADCVFGSRFAGKDARRVLFFKHTIGNKFLTFLSNCCTDLNLTDMETCYKMFKTSVLKTIPIRSNRFGIEPELTAKCAKRGFSIYEVPISYRGRTYLEGKKITWRDGLAAIYTILKYWIIDDSFNEDYGHTILSEMQEAPRFSAWIMEMAQPHINGVVIEVGAGIGNQTRILSLQHRVIATDHDDKYIQILNNVFYGNEFVNTAQWDITEQCPEECRAAGTIFCSNVLEHVEDDNAALHNMRNALKDGGRLILVVPQGKSLFCNLDSNLGHHRRYDKDDLTTLITSNGFRIDEIFSFNKVGVLGWLFKGKLLKRNTLGKVSLKLFNILTPLFRRTDWLLPWKGLSWFVVASVDVQRQSISDTVSSP